jgi:hypothetical protein
MPDEVPKFEKKPGPLKYTITKKDAFKYSDINTLISW